MKLTHSLALLPTLLLSFLSLASAETCKKRCNECCPTSAPLLPYAQLHQGVQRVLQIRRFLLLGQETEMLLHFILCSLGAGWQKNVPLR